MKGADHIKDVENEISSLIAMISGGSPANFAAYSGKLQALLNTAGISPNLVAAANQALLDAGERYRSSISADVYTLEIMGLLNDDQKKLVADFYNSLDALKEDIGKYSETLKDIEAKEREFERLSKAIADNPFSETSKKARAQVGTVIVDMMYLAEMLQTHSANCDIHLEECRAKKTTIEQDKTLTGTQKDTLLKQAESDIMTAEKELQGIKNQSVGYDKKVIGHLENALLENVAIKIATNPAAKDRRQEYGKIMAEGLSELDKKKIEDFVKEAKGSENMHAKYEKFVTSFVEAKVASLAPNEAEKETHGKKWTKGLEKKETRSHTEKLEASRTKETGQLTPER